MSLILSACGLPHASQDGGEDASVDVAMDAATTDAPSFDAAETGSDASTLDASDALADATDATDANIPTSDATDVSDATPDSADAARDASADTGIDAADASPDSAPDSMPDSAPDSMPDSAPDSMPDSAPDSMPDSAPDASTDGGLSLVSYEFDVKPILARRCAPCHTMFSSGGANLASSYAATQLPSYSAPGSTKGAAALLRVRDGSMPQGSGCTGDPARDTGNPACLTASEIATLSAWIAGGQRP